MEANLVPERKSPVDHDHHSEIIMDASAEARIGILRLLSSKSLQGNLFIHPRLGTNFETYEGFNDQVEGFFKALGELFKSTDSYALFLKEASPNIEQNYYRLKLMRGRINGKNWEATSPFFMLEVKRFMSLLIRGLAQPAIEAEDDKNDHLELGGKYEPVKPNYLPN